MQKTMILVVLDKRFYCTQKLSKYIVNISQLNFYKFYISMLFNVNIITISTC